MLLYSQVYSNCFADNFGRPCLLVVLIVSNPSLCINTFQRSPALPCNLTSSKATHYTGIRASAPTSSLAHYFIRHGLHQSRIPISGNYRVVSPTLRQPWISAVDHPQWKPQHVVALVYFDLGQILDHRRRHRTSTVLPCTWPTDPAISV